MSQRIPDALIMCMFAVCFFLIGGHSRKTCFPNPCNGTKSVCVDESRWNNLGGGYRCKCPAHLLGEDCSLIGKTGNPE